MTRDEALIRLLDFDMNREQKVDLLDIIDGRAYDLLYHHKGGKPFPLNWIKVDPNTGVLIGFAYDHPVPYNIEKFADNKWKISVDVCSVFNLPVDYNYLQVLEHIKNTAFVIVGDDTFDPAYWYYAINSSYTDKMDGYQFRSLYINPSTKDANYVYLCEYYPAKNLLVFTNDASQRGIAPDVEPEPPKPVIEGFSIDDVQTGIWKVTAKDGSNWSTSVTDNTTNIYELFHVHDNGQLEVIMPLMNISTWSIDNKENAKVASYEYVKGEDFDTTYVKCMFEDGTYFEYYRDGKLVYKPL